VQRKIEDRKKKRSIKHGSSTPIAIGTPLVQRKIEGRKMQFMSLCIALKIEQKLIKQLKQ